LLQNFHRSACWFLILCCFSSFIAKVTVAGDIENINLDPAPVWVIEYDVGPVDDIPIDEVSNGVFYQMVDDQIQISKSGIRTSYARYIETIVNQAGLDSSSQINLNFDPSYQKVALHSLFILRNGQYLDRLQTAKKTLLNRESELNKQIYSGSLTLNILISDLQVGDTLDYSYTRYGANPVYRNAFSYRRNLNWSVPVNTQHLRILWGKPNPLFVTPRNISPTIEQNILEEFTEYKVTIHKAEVVKTPTQMSAWQDPYGSIYFSESENWRDVVAWAKPLYKFDNIHPSVAKIAEATNNLYPRNRNTIFARRLS